MKLYSSNNDYKLYQGSMLDMLEVIEPNTIDSVICDPPYELNFMGKGWDNSGIAFQPDTWKKCYEVLKPGGYLLAFGGSRTFHRIACAIEDAGFEIRDTIMWLYGSGFPKSMDISKQIDKRGGNNTSFLCDLIKEKREGKNLSQKQLDELMGTSGMVNWWEKGERGITPIQFNKLCETLELPFKNIEEAEREVIGTKKSGGASAWINGMNNKENEEQKYTGFSEWEITAPSTDLAKQWQGWGTSLKPSFEPIIVARKPFKGSLVDNVIEYGVGGINIDECRVGNEIIKGGTMPKMNSQSDGINIYNFGKKDAERIERQDSIGRFPANTILTYDETDFDEVCGGFPNTKSGKNGIRQSDGFNVNDYGKGIGIKAGMNNGEYGDSGSASRYFYCAKASKKDRDEGLDEFEEKTAGERTNRKEGSAGINAYAGATGRARNIHPTVKPTNLMQYLVRLVTPNGGTVLDPFNGSGSTGKAIMYENKERNKNYKYIGIELTEEYLPIAKARIEYVCKDSNTIESLKENTEEVIEGQTNIFDYL